jgi:hypothetical protein
MSEVPIKEYVDRLFTEKQTAMDRVSCAMDKRLDLMNEFRLQLKDQAAQLMPRSEYSAKHEMLLVEVRRIQSCLDKAEGKASAKSLIFVAAMSLAGLLVSIIALLRL